MKAILAAAICGGHPEGRHAVSARTLPIWRGRAPPRALASPRDRRPAPARPRRSSGRSRAAAWRRRRRRPGPAWWRRRRAATPRRARPRSEEHTSELQSRLHLVCRLLLEKKKKKIRTYKYYKKQKKQNK